MSSVQIVRVLVLFICTQLCSIPDVSAALTCRRAILRSISLISHPVRAFTHRRVDLKKTGEKIFHKQFNKKWALEDHLDAHHSSQLPKALKEIFEIQIESYAIAYRKRLSADKQLEKNGESSQAEFSRKFQIFDSSRVSEIFGDQKTAENLKVSEVIAWLKTHQEEVLSDLDSSSHYAARTWVKRGGQILILVGVGAVASFGTSYFNSRAGGLSAAVSEKAYSDSRLSSYQTLYGRLKLEDPEMLNEFLYYQERGEAYYALASKAFSNWARVGKWDAMDTVYSLERIMTDIELGKSLGSPAELQEFRIRILYQFLFNLPEYIGSDFDQELQSFKTVVQFLEKYDPDKAIRTRMLEDRALEIQDD